MKIFIYMKTMGEFLVKKLTHEAFIQRLANVNPNIEVIGKYVNMNTKLQCKFPTCGHEILARPRYLLEKGKCPECNKSVLKSHEEFVHEMSIKNKSIIVKSQYINANSPISCLCNDCKYEWETRPCELLNRPRCPKCSVKTRGENSRKTQQDFIDEIKKKNPTIKIVGKYVGANKKIECECDVCSYHWTPLASSLRRGCGCPNCADSNQTSFFEQLILLSLQKKLGQSSVLSREKTIIGKEIDIYIPSMKTGIEPGNWFWHKDKLNADKEKYEMAKKAGIRLLIVYDAYPEKENRLDFPENDIIVYEKDVSKRRGEIYSIDLLKKIFQKLNINYDFSEADELSLIEAAKSAATKKKIDYTDKLLKIQPNIKPLGPVYSLNKRTPCKCLVCGHEWECIPCNIINNHGCPICNSQKKPVKNIDTGEIFESVSAAALKIGVAVTTLSAAANGKTKTCGGYHWKFA